MLCLPFLLADKHRRVGNAFLPTVRNMEEYMQSYESQFF